ncbi:hypothetical protein SCUCBS95973_004184 [Sporothrix curviconia]|uniref:Aminoglycoside phosphotransferase domain-containing protein n=1 Tax=Sporothrix curviconia TaxID=1260050 RepID=A0ABP0BM25_9PEZI
MYDMLPDTLVLVMEYMPAANLRTVWKSLSSRAKESLTVELGDILKRMWQLPAPADFIGGISEDMGLALAEKSSENWEFHGQRGWKTDFFRRNLPSALSGHPFKLTHGDLHPANILVELDESGDKSGGNDGNNGNEAQYRVKAIVDWDTAGWYPEYWEYGINVALFPWDGDWIEALEEMIGAFPLQAAMLHMVRENIEF